ncbi:MAG: hypothetical protein QXD72_01115 [Candidatus Aenigmatarchaeota archaeon]
MDSKLIRKWKDSGLKPSNFEFLTNRPTLVIGKLPNRDAEVEYICPYCNFYEIKTIQMEKGKKKFKRPNFHCSKCNKIIEVPELKSK